LIGVVVVKMTLHFFLGSFTDHSLLFVVGA